MACAGCGAKYRRINSVTRPSLNTPVKYPDTQKPSKTAVTPPATPKKVDPQTAVGLLSNIANSIPK